MKTLLSAIAATSLLTLAACGESPNEATADNIEDAAENQADALEAQADNTTGAAADALEQRADNVEEAGERAADAVEDNDDTTLANNMTNGM